MLTDNVIAIAVLWLPLKCAFRIRFLSDSTKKSIIRIIFARSKPRNMSAQRQMLKVVSYHVKVHGSVSWVSSVYFVWLYTPHAWRCENCHFGFHSPTVYAQNTRTIIASRVLILTYGAPRCESDSRKGLRSLFLKKWHNTPYRVCALKYIFVDHFWFGVMCRGKWWENSMNHQESPLASIVSYNAYTTLPPPLEMKSHFVLMGLKKGGKCVRWRSCEIVQNEMWTLLRLFVVVALFCRLNDRFTNFHCVHPLSSAFIFPTNKTHYCLYINFVNILKANTLHSLARTISTLSK